MDRVSSVMGADDNVMEELKIIAGKNRPKPLTILTTGLAETRGTDIKYCVNRFRETYPDYADVAVVGVHTPDCTGRMESGYAATVTEILKEPVPESRVAGTRRHQVNVAESLDGHPDEAEFNPPSTGGTPIPELASLGDAAATLAIGAADRWQGSGRAHRRARPFPLYRFYFNMVQFDRAEAAARNALVETARQAGFNPG